MASFAKTNESISFMAISIEKPISKSKRDLVKASYLKDQFIMGDVFFHKNKKK